MSLRPLEYAILAKSPMSLPNRQWIGLPPELTDGADLRERMPLARVLVIMKDSDDSLYLYRFGAGVVAAGDTRHRDVAEAKGQAEFEYGAAVGDWHLVPDGISDFDAFLRALSV